MLQAAQVHAGLSYLAQRSFHVSVPLGEGFCRVVVVITTTTPYVALGLLSWLKLDMRVFRLRDKSLLSALWELRTLTVVSSCSHRDKKNLERRSRQRAHTSTSPTNSQVRVLGTQLTCHVSSASAMPSLPLRPKKQIRGAESLGASPQAPLRRLAHLLSRDCLGVDSLIVSLGIASYYLQQVMLEHGSPSWEGKRAGPEKTEGRGGARPGPD
ncbi:hypothetical protein J3F83DRAFT_603657 [Trichoderma novae-zelandiae]